MYNSCENRANEDQKWDDKCGGQKNEMTKYINQNSQKLISKQNA